MMQLKAALLTVLMSMALFVPIAVTVSTLAPHPVYAQANCDGGNFLGIKPWHQYIQKDPARACAIIMDFPQDIWKIVLGVLDIMFKIAGYIAVGFVIFGGIRLMMSQGEPEGVKGAKDTIINACVGLGITILAVTIVSFVAGSLN